LQWTNTIAEGDKILCDVPASRFSDELEEHVPPAKQQPIPANSNKSCAHGSMGARKQLQGARYLDHRDPPSGNLQQQVAGRLCNVFRTLHANGAGSPTCEDQHDANKSGSGLNRSSGKNSMITKLLCVELCSDIEAYFLVSI
jgi:hypothetical protein